MKIKLKKKLDSVDYDSYNGKVKGEIIGCNNYEYLVRFKDFGWDLSKERINKTKERLHTLYITEEKLMTSGYRYWFVWKSKLKPVVISIRIN